MGKESNLDAIDHNLGVSYSNFEMDEVKEIYVDPDFMIGGDAIIKLKNLLSQLEKSHLKVMLRYMLKQQMILIHR